MEKGSKPKINISFTLPGTLSMDDVDFTCEFFTENGSKSQTIAKSGMIRIDSGNYVAIVDTDATGRGILKMRYNVSIPDNDVSGGIRPEIDTITVVDTDALTDLRIK